MPRPRTPSADDLLALLDALPASVALWDSEVRLRYGNQRSLTRFGRSLDELHRAHLSDLVQAHAVELSARYIDGALAGKPQQVERAMVDLQGQRYNAHQVTHVPNVVDGRVVGYCALAVDITASIEGYEQARRAREQAALRAERERIADDIHSQRVVDNLSAALERLGEALDRASDAVPSLSTAADAIDGAIEELRATVPARMLGESLADAPLVAYPSMSAPFDATFADRATGVRWPTHITGRDWPAEDALALLDLLPAVLTIWDASFRCVFVNRAAVRYYGQTDRPVVVGQHARDLLGPELFDANVALAQAAMQGEPQDFERTIAHPTGLRHMQVSYVPWAGGICSFAVDVTARVEAELALQDAHAELASARERERIADELHNLVIQRLFAAGLAAMHPSPDVTDAQVRSVQDGIVAALADLESAMTTLHESTGLLDLLPDLARIVHDTALPRGIEIAIENVGSVDYVPPTVGVELLAVAEAALSNVAIHSGASQVVVTVAADDAGVWLRVVDDGRGLGVEPAGKGMADMSSRAARLGGTCTWRPNLPSGTVVDWRVPTPQPA